MDRDGGGGALEKGLGAVPEDWNLRPSYLPFMYFS